jgi:hypothetical protein
MLCQVQQNVCAEDSQYAYHFITVHALNESGNAVSHLYFTIHSGSKKLLG